MSSPIALQELFKAGFENFAIPVLETAPFTTIQNRAKVTRSLKAIAGVERIHVRSVNLLQNEFGPNGERVWEPDTKDARIRFVGGWSSSGSTDGTFVVASSTADFVEVTFYGTGLNAMTYVTGARDVRAIVDGGSEGSNIIPAGTSSVIYNRNYSPSTLLSVASGLILGWHTVRLRNANASNSGFYGFEILNQRSNLAVYSGAGISNGAFTGLSALSTSSFNEGVTGTKGARVAKYIENGTLKSAVQEVDATTKYLTNADHTNEEIVRRINFREFGANRADDFSTLTTTASSRAFTLDDGTTTLVGQNARGNPDEVYQLGAGDFLTLTFVGTGLDIVGLVDSTAQYSVDGVSIGTQAVAIITNRSTIKIASGLPYGTHTVKFTRAGAGTGYHTIADFIIYQPKKPSIPVGSFEVADYNLMANYVYNSNALVEMSTGLVRKVSTREMTYTGTWSATLDVSFANSGFLVSSSTSTSTIRYTFWGTGIEWFFKTNASLAMNINIAVDGASNFTVANGSPVGGAGWTSALTTQYLPASTGTTFTASTGNLTGTSAGQGDSKIVLNGLTLGLHTIVITQNAANNTCLHDCFDIINPIHINNPTLKVGSQSLKSVTKYSPEKSVLNAGPDLSKAKAWVVIDQVSGTILSSYNVSAVLTTGTSTSRIYFEKPFKNSNYASVATGSTAQVDEDGKFPNYVIMTGTNSAGSVVANVMSVVVFGELIDE